MALRATYAGQRVNNRAIRHEFRDHDGPVGRLLDESSGRVLTAARLGVGVRSGTLLASGRREFGQRGQGPYVDVTFGVPGLTDYLGYHMDGTPPHIIRATRRSALRFVSGGQVRFARQVRHPGTAANPFLVRALAAA